MKTFARLLAVWMVSGLIMAVLPADTAWADSFRNSDCNQRISGRDNDNNTVTCTTEVPGDDTNGDNGGNGKNGKNGKKKVFNIGVITVNIAESQILSNNQITLLEDSLNNLHVEILNICKAAATDGSTATAEDCVDLVVNALVDIHVVSDILANVDLLDICATLTVKGKDLASNC